MKRETTAILAIQLLLTVMAGAYPIDTARLVEITSTNQMLAFIRNSDRVELEFAGPTDWSRDGKNISRPADDFTLSNATNIAAFVGRPKLTSNPNPCCCGHQCSIVFWQQDRPLVISICAKCFTVVSLDTDGTRAVAHFRMPGAIWEAFEQYRLLHRRIEAELLGVSKGADGVPEVIWQGRWKLINRKIGDEIEGFRIERYDEQTQRVLFVCLQTGRELWMK
jgi:hypothetical protein